MIIFSIKTPHSLVFFAQYTTWLYYELTSDQLPTALIAQLIEHYIGIAEVMSSNPRLNPVQG